MVPNAHLGRDGEEPAFEGAARELDSPQASEAVTADGGLHDDTRDRQRVTDEHAGAGRRGPDQQPDRR